MALAGPVANLLLLVLAGIAIRVGYANGWLLSPEVGLSFPEISVAAAGGGWKAVATFINIMFCLNLLLFVFNLLPVPPLDGSAIIMLFMEPEKARRYQLWLINSQLSFSFLLIAWIIFPKIFDPIFVVTLELVTGLKLE